MSVEHYGRSPAGFRGRAPDIEDLCRLLGRQEPSGNQRDLEAADAVRRRYMGDGIFLRGIVEFSSYCRNTCFYCGSARGNARLTRYRMSAEEILESVRRSPRRGFSTVVLQSGRRRWPGPRVAGGGGAGDHARGTTWP